MKNALAVLFDALQEMTLLFGSGGIDGECCGDLSFIEFVAIKKAREHPGLMIKDLGHALNLTKSGATRIVDRLEKKRYLRRNISPHDGRVCCVTISPRGARIVARVEGREIGRLGRALQAVGRGKIDKIASDMALISRALRKITPPKSAPRKR